MSTRNLMDRRNLAIRCISYVLAILVFFAGLPANTFAQINSGSLPAYAYASPISMESTASPSPPPASPLPTETAPPASPSVSPSSPPTWTPSPSTPAPPMVFVPKVSTGVASDVQPESATLNGNITDDGGDTITDAGFIWWPPNGQSVIVYTGSKLQYTLTGLSENTAYTYYAFATNRAGTSSGQYQTFTTPAKPLTVKTLEATDIGFDKATLHGNAVGGGKLIASGFQLTSPLNKSYSVIPGSDGSMDMTISGLKPGVAYSFYAFATNDKGKLNGSTLSFTTLKIVPRVDTLFSTNIDMTTADLYGSIVERGSSNILESGFLWGTDPKPGNKVILANGSSTGPINHTLKNLRPDTTYYFQAYAANTEGIGYGSVLSFKALSGKPQVETWEADGVTPVEARIAGYVWNSNILADQKMPVTSSGFLWGQGDNPDIKVSVKPGADLKSLSHALKGLKPNTTYYYKAFATNSEGTAYGNIKSFKTGKGEPIVQCDYARDVNATGAYITAIISNEPLLKQLGIPVTDSGFLWGTSPNPDKKVSVRNGIQSFWYTLKGLKSGTTYYYRAYATNLWGTAYSGIFSFTTAKGLPTVETLPAAKITPFRAAIAGNILNAQELKAQGLAITDSGFLWGTAQKPANKLSVNPGQTGESLYYTFTNLKDDTAYYIQAYATNTAGTSYGEIISFTTPNGDPEVETWEPGNISPMGASLAGFIVENKGSLITDSGFLIGTDPKSSKKISCKPGADDRTLISKIDGLKTETTYYVQAYATNIAGTGYGELISFTTPNGDPQVETRKPGNISPTGASLEGFIVKNKGFPITDSGFLIGTDPEPGKKISIKPEADGRTLISTIDGLEAETTYYVQAYATSIAGTGYGEVMKFTTATKAPKVETRPYGVITSVSGEINGFIVEDYGYEITDSGFFWGTDPDPDTMLSVSPGADDKALAHLLSNLRGGTKYYVQAFAVNSQGIGYGEIFSFTTNPSVVPSVVTSSADFDALKWQPFLKGNISSNGGDSVVEYGFRYSSDQKTWTTYKVGSGDYKGDFDASVSTTDRLPAGPYYVQAYAVNSAGTGFGAKIKFVTPTLPVVTCAAASPATGATGAVLTGNVTDTGGKGIFCEAVQFQYRKSGTEDWLDAGIHQGSYGTGEFTFDLEGLDPGTQYEFAALARNCAGIGISPIIAFTTGWGTDANQAVQNMKASGVDAVKIVGILNGTYKVSGESAYYALLQGDFKVEVIIPALKSSSYGLTYSRAVSFMKGSAFDILTIAGILRSVFSDDMRKLGEGRPLNETINVGISICLKSAGYGVDDIISVMRTVFTYSIADCFNKLRLGSLFTNDEVYGGLIRSFTGTAVAVYIWHGYDNTYGKSPALAKIAGILKTNGSLSAAEVAQAFKVIYPSISMEELSGGLSDAGYDISDIGDVVADLYGNDPQLLAKALLTYTGFSPSKIEDYLIKGRNVSPQDMVRVINNVFYNNVRSYDEIPRVFTIYYSLNAEAAAKAMYTAGYNLDYLVRVMEKDYPTTVADMMGIFSKIGLPSQSAISKACDMYPKYDWLKEYRIQGYSAADYAAYAKANPGQIFGINNPEAYSSQYGLTKRAETTVCDLVEVGYSLSDAVLAIKNVYGFDETTVLSIFTAANNTGKLNLIKEHLVAAINQAYGTDSILASIRSMLNSGSSAVQLAMTLYDGFEIKDPEKAADYLVKAGCSEGGIMDGLGIIYYKKSASRDTLEKLNKTHMRIGNQNGMRAAIDSVIRYTGGEAEPAGIARLLNEDGYSLKEMFLIFKLNYSLAPYQAIDAMISALGEKSQVDIAAEVTGVYGTDVIPGYAQSLRNKGYSPEKCLSAISSMFKLTDPVKMATCMNLAGYGQDEVLSALLKMLYSGDATEEALKELSDVMKKAYDKVLDDMAAILNAGGIKDPSAAVHALYQNGYAISNIVYAIKDQYGVLSGDAIHILTKSLLFQQKDITSTVQSAYGIDFAQAFLLSMQSQGLDAETIDSSGSILLLNKGAYSLSDIMRALKGAYYLTPEQAIDVLTKSGLYQQKDIVAQIQAVYGLDNTQIYTQYLQSKGYSSGTIDADAIILLNQGGFRLTDIARALKSINGLTSEQTITMLENSGLYPQMDILSQVQAVFGLNNSQICIQYLQSRGYDINTIDPAVEIQLLSRAGYRLEDIARLLKDVNQLTALQALEAIIKSGRYDQRTIGTVWAITYGGDLTSVYHQYLTDNGIDATSADYSGVAMTMYYAGYDLMDMIRALKDMYKLPMDKTVRVLKGSVVSADNPDIAILAPAIYDGDVLSIIKYWQSKGYRSPTVFSMLDRIDITDNIEKFSYMRKAGYSDDDIWERILNSSARNDLFMIIKNLYMLNDPVSIVKQIQQIPVLQRNIGRGIDTIADELSRLFPGISDVDVAKTLKAAGYPVYGPNEFHSVFNWLWSSKFNGKRDDALMSILGSAHPDDLQLEAYPAMLLISARGYSMEEAVEWGLKNNFAWRDFFYYINQNYGYGKYYPDTVSIIAALKSKYSIDDLIAGNVGSYGRGMSAPTSYFYSRTYGDLLDAGYSMDEAMRGILRQGSIGVRSLIATMYDKSISVAHSARDQSLRLSCTQIVDMIYNAGLTMEGVDFSLSDIAGSLVEVGPNSGEFAKFSTVEIYEAMKVITGKYLQRVGSDAPVDIATFYLLREGGLRPSDAAATLAEMGVGLSTASIIKSMIGIGNDWMKAVTIMMGAGYGAQESLSAVYCNKDYHNMIGVSILSTLITKALTWLDDAGDVAVIIKTIRKVSETGFKLGDIK